VRLDASQAAAVAIVEGQSLAVLGAPGTGKTTTLVELVAERVENRGYSPDEVLVLSATRATATSLRDRLALRLGVPSNGPLARTANSVAFQILQGVAAIGGAAAPVLLTGAEQDQIISDLLLGQIHDGAGPSWPNPLGEDVRRLRGFRTELRDLMMRAVENGISPDRLRELAAGAGRPEWAAAAEFISGYDAVKASFRDRSFDSAELAREAAVLLREGSDSTVELAAAIGSLAKLRLIVVDDAQESPRATLTLLREFARRGVAVVAFGDPDVTTGSFRGAHPDTLGRLAVYLGTTPVPALVLSTVHRHGAEIRSLVAAVTERIGTAQAGAQRRAQSAAQSAAAADPQDAAPQDAAPHEAVSHEAVAPHEPAPVAPRIVTVLASSPSDEIAVIARRLREAHVFDGIAFNDMAVIVRSGRQIGPLERGLAAFDVPTRVSRARVALRDEPIVRAFTGLLELAYGRRELDGPLAEFLLVTPLAGADAVLLRRLKRALRQLEFDRGGSRPGNELLVEAILDPEVLGQLEARVARWALKLSGLIRGATSLAATEASVEEVLWELWQGSNLADGWYQQSLGTGLLAEEINRNLDVVVSLFSAAKRFVERTPQAPGTVFLEQLLDTEVPEDTLAVGAVGQAVSVTTPTATIGDEYRLVVVAGVQENVWPNLRIRGSLLGAGSLEDVLAVAESGESAAGLSTDIAAQRTEVLHDELRMFAQAVSRSAGDLLITAVSDENTAPSPLFRLLPAPTSDGISRNPLSLRGLVGVLRRTMTFPTSGAGAIRDAAAALATLADERIPGAHPTDWYGLAEISTLEPLVDLDAVDPEDPSTLVRVSPSRMESFEACPLDWLVNQLGGSSGNTAAQIGTLIHKAMETATDISADALFADVQGRWGELSFESEWLSELAQSDARKLVGRLASYLRDFQSAHGNLVQAESVFALPVGHALLSGSIDRVEYYPDGSIVIVDLKTGAKAYSAAEIATNPQLGAYQLAFAAGMVPNVPADSTSGGARLLIVSKGTVKKNYADPTQEPFSAEELEAFRQRVLDAATGMAGSTFEARIGTHCLDPYSHGACRVHVIKAVSS
jgi:superfamily I DNA/RNA helicase/RecB family exonuclease